MGKRRKKMSIIRRMMFAVLFGFCAGFLCLLLREFLLGNGSDEVWNVINAIFFQDITATDGIEGIGLFYIISQLFMRGLQMSIVPLVITSLTLALCSLADPERLGKIAGKTIGTFVGFYVCGATLALSLIHI